MFYVLANETPAVDTEESVSKEETKDKAEKKGRKAILQYPVEVDHRGIVLNMV